MWNGLRIQNNVEGDYVWKKMRKKNLSSQQTRSKQIFATEKIPRTWKLPNHDSPW
jgi:hypothetical protein